MAKLLFVTLSERKRFYFSVLLLILNLISTLIAIALNGISIYVIIYFQSTAHLLSDSFSFTAFSTFYFLESAITAALSSFLCALLFYSRKSRRRIKVIEKGYFNLLLFLYLFNALILMPAIIIYTKIFINQTFHGFAEGMKEKLRNFAEEEEERIVFNELQFEYQCCGVDGFHDWKAVPRFARDQTVESVPFSCCKIDYTDPSSDVNCRNSKLDNQRNLLTINTNGCADQFRLFITARLWTAIVLWVIILLLHLSSLLLFQYWKSSTESAHQMKGHPKEKGEGWLSIPTFGLYESTPPGYHKIRTNEDKYSVKGEEDLDWNDVHRVSPLEKSVRLMRDKVMASPAKTKAVDTKAISTAPRHQPLPFPSPPPTSPRYKPSSVTSSINCPQCHRKIISDYERHLCVKSVIDDREHSVMMVKLDSDQSKDNSSSDNKNQDNVKRNKKYTKNKPKNDKLGSEMGKRMKDRTDSTVNTTEEEVEIKRKYRERYFILKEIR